MVERVVATPEALALIACLQAEHGALIFHQSGGCCDNSAANCYLPGEITMGAGDVYLGDIGGCRFYIGKAQYETWKHTQLIIDVIEGTGGTFSLEGPEGKAFHTARWDDSAPIDGAKVGLIGCGSTGIQIVTAINKRVDKLVHFQRSPQWVMPVPQFPYTDAEREAVVLGGPAP